MSYTIPVPVPSLTPVSTEILTTDGKISCAISPVVSRGGTTGVGVGGEGVSPGPIVGIGGVGVGGNVIGVGVGVGGGTTTDVGVGGIGTGIEVGGSVIGVGVGGNVIAVGVGGKTMAVGVGGDEVHAIASISPAEKTARVSRLRDFATRFRSIIISPGLALPVQ